MLKINWHQEIKEVHFVLDFNFFFFWWVFMSWGFYFLYLKDDLSLSDFAYAMLRNAVIAFPPRCKYTRKSIMIFSGNINWRSYICIYFDVSGCGCEAYRQFVAIHR